MMLLKTLMNYTDEKIYNELIAGFENDQYYKSCIQNMLCELHEESLHTNLDCQNYLGQLFRQRYKQNLPQWCSNEDVTNFIMQNNVLIHLKKNVDKFNLIVFMVKKLFQVVQDKSKLEGADVVMMQELLLGGHLYQKIFKEFLENWLNNLKYNLIKKLGLNDSQRIKASDILATGRYSGTAKKSFEHFLSTGNNF